MTLEEECIAVAQLLETNPGEALKVFVGGAGSTQKRVVILRELGCACWTHRDGKSAPRDLWAVWPEEK